MSKSKKALIAAHDKGYSVINSRIFYNGREVKANLKKNGYTCFCIRYEKQRCVIFVHRLVAYQKYGNDLFKNGIEVRHRNGIRSDNSPDNILIGSHSDNMQDISESIRLKKSLHATSFVRKYKREDVVKFYNENESSYKITMRHFNISSKGTLHFILNGRPKKK